MISGMLGPMPAPHSLFWQHLEKGVNLGVSIIALLTGLFVPIQAYLREPAKFGANYYVVPVRFSQVHGENREPTGHDKKGETTSDTKLRASQSLLRLRIWNSTSAVQHNVTVRVPRMKLLSGLAAQAKPITVNGLNLWETAVLAEGKTELQLPNLPELPVGVSLDVWVWGDFAFDVFQEAPAVRSAEGPASITTLQLLQGWPLFFGTNAWWIVSLAAFGVGIAFLRRFEKAR